MNVVCISEDIKKLKEMKRICEEAEIFDEIKTFFNEYDVEEYMKVNVASLVFLDIDIHERKVLDQLYELRKYHKHVNVLTVSNSEDLAYKAYQQHVSGYLVWPVTADQIVEECEFLRFSLPKDEKRVFAKTFGNFELYVDGRPALFKNGKTKELFAYLFERGTMCTNKEIMSVLWEDDEDHSSYLKKLRVDLLETLRFLGCEDLIIKNRGAIGIEQKKLSSDWYEWQAKTQEGLNAFQGEFMSQYSWAESRLSYILNSTTNL